jgi:hypothetical protein
MTKLDLDRIFEQGDGRPVPKEMDRHMVKYVIWQRKRAAEKAVANNDNSPFVTNRWDHSDISFDKPKDFVITICSKLIPLFLWSDSVISI